MAMVPRLTRILYFLPMLFITFVMSSMFAFDDGMVAHVVPKKDTTKDEECTPLYFTEVCDSSMLRSEFSKRRCCEQNCIANLLKMPLDVSVTPCCPSHSQYCLPTSSSSRSSDLQYFSETVAINRAAIQIKRVTKEDIRNNDEQYIVEKKARWRKHWVDYFIDHKKPGSNGTARFNWKYEIYTKTYDKISVCRSAFMAIYGVKFEELRYFQDLARSNESSGTSKYDLTMEKADERKTFERFGLNYDFYLFNLDSYVRLEKVITLSLVHHISHIPNNLIH